ncbi:MAG: flagellar hook-basal body complex protein FliE [Pseudomonadota bacterium]
MQVNQTQADMNALLQQMRALRDQTGEIRQLPQIDRPSESTNVSNTVPSEFGGMLESAIQSVNQLQKTSGRSANDFVTGRENDLVKVMIDSQKSSLGFQAMVQVRNRFVTAYQDIMNMPI